MKAPLVRRRDVLRDRFREGFRRRDVLRHPNQPATIVGCVPGRPHRARWREWSHTARADSGQSYLRSCEQPAIFQTCVFVHYLSRHVKRVAGELVLLRGASVSFRPNQVGLSRKNFFTRWERFGLATDAEGDVVVAGRNALRF